MEEPLGRKLTSDETKELKGVLKPILSEGDEEDISDLLDYALAMLSNQKTPNQIISELVSMEMDFCPSNVAENVGKAVADFIAKSNETTDAKVVSIKSSETNALTMSGALGASREGGKKQEPKQPKKTKGNDNKKQKDTPQGRAFDKLARGGGRGGRGRSDERAPRGGRGRGRDTEERGGRGGRQQSNRSGGRNQGNRRSRDEFEEEPDFVSAARGTPGRGARGGPNPKFQRYEEEDYTGRGGRRAPSRGFVPRGGRGRGRFPARGEPEQAQHIEERHDQGAVDESGYDQSGYDQSGYDPSYQQGYQPFYRGRGYSSFYRGRGRGRSFGRGRTFYPGRSDVQSMLASKQWVRKKDGEEGDQNGDEGGES